MLQGITVTVESFSQVFLVVNEVKDALPMCTLRVDGTLVFIFLLALNQIGLPLREEHFEGLQLASIFDFLKFFEVNRVGLPALTLRQLRQLVIVEDGGDVEPEVEDTLG